jgi:hypothetical protein
MADGWNPEDGMIIQGDIVTMNETMNIIGNGRLVIVGEKIIAILQSGDNIPNNPDLSRAISIKTNGLIFPGLIDSHNHVAYNVLPLYQVPKKYDNRYQWGNPASYSQHVNYPKKLLCESKYYDLDVEVIKYAEVKAIVGGVTSIQGSPNLTATRLLVRNIEHKNFGQDRIYQRGLTIADSRWQKTLEDGLLRLMNEGKVDAWLVHLAEGTDDDSKAEFALLKELGLLTDKTVFIHGTALEREHFKEMAQKGTKLIWSPLSNFLLYGNTTDIPTALEEGVLVSLGTDWSPSGSKNLLGELKIAHKLDETRFGDIISDQELVKMVTVYPAFALGLDDKIGQIKPGYYADIAVYEKINEDPYRSLIDCTERHVRLVVINGEPLYGDREIMEIVKPGDFEILSVAGIEKAIDTTTPGITKGNQKLSEIKDLLTQALLLDHEHMWETFGEEMSLDEFETFLDNKFKDGIIPKRLDPIFAFGDKYFFDSINNSTIANIGFDISQYWKVDVTPNGEKSVIAFINSPQATFEVLDVKVALDKRAAGNIIKHRDGPDELFGTSDDNPFDSIEALDAIPYVGRSALEKLRTYVSKNMEGDALILLFINNPDTTLEILDVQVGLDRRAAINIIAHRNGADGQVGTADDDPIDSISELDEIKYVGKSAMEKVKIYVLGN